MALFSQSLAQTEPFLQFFKRRDSEEGPREGGGSPEAPDPSLGTRPRSRTQGLAGAPQASPPTIVSQQLWRELFSPLHALNFGIGGDSTQHVLWRLENGELEHIRPKIVVVWVGTNNHGHTAEQVTAGIEAIVGLVNQRQPQARVVVLALLPRGQHPNPLREKNRRVNELVRAALAGRPRAHFLDADPGFVHSDGTISHHDMYDYLHLTRLGYTPVCRALHALLLRLLAAGQGPPQPEPGP